MHSILGWILLIPVVGGSVYGVLCLIAVLIFPRSSLSRARFSFQSLPPVTLLKPVCGLEKNLRVNLRSACLQEYPLYQVVFSVQDARDTAIPIFKELQEEFGSKKVSWVIENIQAGPNGKINNLLGGMTAALHDVLVISDSDIHLRPDYLRTIVEPLADPEVGYVCTLFKGACADLWYEKMEMLTLNTDFMPSVIFANMTGAARACLGASIGLRRSTLDEIGGLAPLANYLVEDFEMGRRIRVLGKKFCLVPYMIDTMVDLKKPSQWVQHQIYWDQNTRAAQPWGFFFTILVRSVPFALLFALFRLGDGVGLTVLAAGIGFRMMTAALILGLGFRDWEGLRSLYLLPVRDAVALATWFMALSRRKLVWRGIGFELSRDGRLIRLEAQT